MHHHAVRKLSTNGPTEPAFSTVKLTLPPRRRCGGLDEVVSYARNLAWNGDKMGVLVYIALTVAVFAVLGLAQKLVERL